MRWSKDLVHYMVQWWNPDDTGNNIHYAIKPNVSESKRACIELKKQGFHVSIVRVRRSTYLGSLK